MKKRPFRRRYERKSRLNIDLPTSSLDKLEAMAERYRTTRTDILEQLIDVGMYIEGKIGLVETWTNEDLEELRLQARDEQIVDWVANLDVKKFTALMHVFESESKIRGLRPK